MLFIIVPALLTFNEVDALHLRISKDAAHKAETFANVAGWHVNDYDV